MCSASRDSLGASGLSTIYSRKRPSHSRPQTQTEGTGVRALYEAQVADEDDNRTFKSHMDDETRRW
jgi:hypothetical protein